MTDHNSDDPTSAVLAELQPLRDLAKNWDIDIASCLEEYLQECIAEFPVSVQEQHDKTSSSLNFAQAALVVQNSSHIYGRKVEFLYSLTYKTLEELSAQGANPAAKRKSAEDPDIDEFFNYDPHQEFLLLNDVLPTDESPEGRKINLAPARGDNGRRSSLSSRGRRSMTPRSRTLHSGLAEQRTRNVSSFYAAALAGDADGKGSSLRLMDCELGQDGCLLMPEVADFTRKRESLADELVFSETGHVQNGEGNAEGVTPNEDVGGYGGGSFPDDDDDDGGGGFEFAHDTAPMDVSEPPQGDSPGGTREPMKRVTFADEAKPPPEDDPWELLDPYVPDTTKPRPLRIGRTIVLPAGLEELPSECIAGAPRRRVPRQAPQQPLPWSRSLVTETFRATLANSRKRRNAEMDKDWDDPAERPVLPLKGLAYGDEFAYIAKEAARRKRAELREKRKQRMAAAVSGSSGETAKNDDNAVCDEGGFDYGGDDDDGFDYGDGGAAFGDNDEGPILTNTGMVEVGEVYQNIGVHRDDDSNADARTFEQLCRAHIEAFARGAEKYAVETQLSKRVDRWQERLAPLLEEEEKRPVFDIHEYGETVIKSLMEGISRTKNNDPSNKTISFAEVTAHASRYEVCRLFLASLSLGGSGNVNIFQPNNDKSAPLQLELLCRDIERPMETYLAPSVAETS